VSGTAFLGLILVLGGAATASDWRESRVPNHIALLGLAAFVGGVVFHLLASACGHRGWHWLDLGVYYMPWRFFPMLGVHAFLSLTAGWILWRLDVWPAGDAKLYIVLSWLLPLANANLTGFPQLLFMVFLINCFVPPGLLYAAEGLVRLIAAVPGTVSGCSWLTVKAAGDRLIKRFQDLRAFRPEAAAVIVNLISLFFILRLAEARLHRQSLGSFGQLMIFLAMFAVWQQLSSFLRRPRIGVAALAVFCACAVSAAATGLDLAALLWRTAKMMINFAFFLSFARVAFEKSLERSSLGVIAPEELRTGALLSQEAWDALSADEEAKKILGERNCDGLTAEEAAALRARLSSRGERLLSVYRGVPFAAWIFLGALLTLARPGTVVSWMLR